ncbi:MAG: MTH938/NDUFAF3 family protein [Pseudomonadota bacterium]|nr:MTH938/NDUFAF3 family protein [Pseudomonadota bacterium]
MPEPEQSNASEPWYPRRAPIDGYGDGFFRFAGVRHPGSLLILPSGMRGWRPANLTEVRQDDLDAVLAERQALGLLLFGVGRMMAALPGPLRAFLTVADIGFEAMDTGAAVRTYNILLAENRAVAAALLAVP